MPQTRTPRASLYRFVASLLGIALIGISCAEGGGGGGGDPGGSGSVGVLLTDGPTDDFLQILLRVSRVELLGEPGRALLFEGDEEIDLLTLRDDSQLLGLGRNVPSGDWSKIRLQVADVRLIRESHVGALEGVEVGCPEGFVPEPDHVCESITPKLGGGGKLDLNPRGPIRVEPGELLLLELDLDAEKSIHIHQTGNGRTQFRPVVFVEAFRKSAPHRFVRVTGVVQEVSPDAGELTLCRTHPVRELGDDRERPEDDDGDDRDRPGRPNRPDREGCLRVSVQDDTSIFDEMGDLIRLSELRVGDRASALGRLRAGRELSLVLDAVLVQLGGFDAQLAVNGEVLDGVAGDPPEFPIAPAPGGPVQGDELLVRLLDGAKLFTRAGRPVVPEDLAAGQKVRARGWLLLSDTEPDLLEATLVFVAPVPLPPGPLRGVIALPFDPDTGELVLNARSDGRVGPRCVALEPGDAVFRIRELEDMLHSQRIEPGDLETGEIVDVFGTDEGRCMDAEALISLGFSE